MSEKKETSVQEDKSLDHTVPEQYYMFDLGATCDGYQSPYRFDLRLQERCGTKEQCKNWFLKKLQEYYIQFEARYAPGSVSDVKEQQVPVRLCVEASCVEASCVEASCMNGSTLTVSMGSSVSHDGEPHEPREREQLVLTELSYATNGGLYSGFGALLVPKATALMPRHPRLPTRTIGDIQQYLKEKEEFAAYQLNKQEFQAFLQRKQHESKAQALPNNIHPQTTRAKTQGMHSDYYSVYVAAQSAFYETCGHVKDKAQSADS